MSTAPSAAEFEQTLKQLHQLTLAMLEKPSMEIAELQAFISQREPLIHWLQEADALSENKALEPHLQVLLQEIQAADVKIEAHFQQMLTAHGKDMRQLVKARQVLTGYRFPLTQSSSGVENQA